MNSLLKQALSATETHTLLWLARATFAWIGRGASTHRLPQTCQDMRGGWQKDGMRADRTKLYMDVGDQFH